jgi:hypothetical protein
MKSATWFGALSAEQIHHDRPGRGVEDGLFVLTEGRCRG